jgi:hypothetical protein
MVLCTRWVFIIFLAQDSPTDKRPKTQLTNVVADAAGMAGMGSVKELRHGTVLICCD